MESQENQSNSFFKSSKDAAGHGFGLKIVEEVVRKWGGIVKYEYVENVFCVSVLFRMRESNEGRKA